MKKVDGKDAEEYRFDPCGAVIQWSKYGNRNDIYGWEVDHIVPKAILCSKGATDEEIDDYDNLRPMQWENNDAKGTDYPAYHTKVIYLDGHNQRVDGAYEVNKPLQTLLKSKYSKYGI